jgi:phosphoserine phosphatase
VTTLLLVRHGHVDGINPERFRGRNEVALSLHGQQQALAVARRIASQWRPRAIYVSPLQRCTQTAAAIAAATGATAECCDDLVDLNYGDWQWLTRDEVRARWPALLEKWDQTPHLVRFPNGESLQDLAARVSNVLRMLLERHADETVAVVGHDSGNRALLLQLLEQSMSAYWRLSQDPCGLNIVELTPGNVRVITLNDTSHL